MKLGFEDLVPPKQSRWEKFMRWLKVVFGRAYLGRILRNLLGIMVGWAVVYLTAATLLSTILLAFWYLMATWFGMLEVKPLLHFENPKLQLFANQMIVTFAMSVIILLGLSIIAGLVAQNQRLKKKGP